MNDSMEGRWLYKNFLDRLNLMGYKERIFAEFLKSTQIKFTIGPFIFCLSAEGDLLSQWRAYADGGSGVAVGFSGEKFNAVHRPKRPIQIPGQTIFNPVIYDSSIQEQFLDDMCKIVKKIIDECEQYIFINPETHPYVAIAAEINLALYYVEPFFKNPAFSKEKEWRIVYFPRSSIMNSWSNKISQIYLSEEKESESLHFRASNKLLIPYFLFPFEGEINSTISHIKLGPTAVLDKNIIALFMRKHGSSDFLFDHSTASLR